MTWEVSDQYTPPLIHDFHYHSSSYSDHSVLHQGLVARFLESYLDDLVQIAAENFHVKRAGHLISRDQIGAHSKASSAFRSLLRGPLFRMLLLRAFVSVLVLFSWIID